MCLYMDECIGDADSPHVCFSNVFALGRRAQDGRARRVGGGEWIERLFCVLSVEGFGVLVFAVRDDERGCFPTVWTVTTSRGTTCSPMHAIFSRWITVVRALSHIRWPSMCSIGKLHGTLWAQQKMAKTRFPARPKRLSPSSKGATASHKQRRKTRNHPVPPLPPLPITPQAASAAPRVPLFQQITADQRCRSRRRNKLFQKRTAAGGRGPGRRILEPHRAAGRTAGLCRLWRDGLLRLAMARTLVALKRV